ncbi:MAG: RND transporter family protein [Pirellulaceae bacterium]
MKSDFFARRALWILCGVFFLVPFGLRGARMAWERLDHKPMQWLPDSYEASQELAWLAEHFPGAPSYVLLTWEGCSDQDESFRLFEQKLRHEIRPAHEELIGDEQFNENETVTDSGSEADGDRNGVLSRELTRGRQWGDQLGLFIAGDAYNNWGGLQEKWLHGSGASWYYITPSGELFRWNGRSHLLGALGRLFQRTLLGNRSPDGTLVARFGRPPTPNRRNRFHDDPQRLTARVLESVTTGPELLAALSSPGGPLWPSGKETDAAGAQSAQRRALKRLQGTFFGPEPYAHYDWTASNLPHVVPESIQARMPRTWESTVDAYIENLVRTQYDGQRSELLAASLPSKAQHWQDLYAALGMEPPGVPTCILVTLSPAAQADLQRVLGRGVLGATTGKLVRLAAESGVRAPAPPPLLPGRSAVPDTGKVLRLSGPLVGNVAFHEEARVTLVQLTCSLAAVGLLLGYACFRRVTVTAMMLIVGGISALFGMTAAGWPGQSVDLTLVGVPALILVLGLAGTIYFVRAYRATASQRGAEGAPLRAMARAILPCSLASVTIGIGLLSLAANPLEPVRQFGLVAAVGVLATLVVLLSFLPSALQLWVPKFERHREETDPRSLFGRMDAVWRWLTDWVIDNQWLVVGSAAMVIVAMGFGLARLTTSVQLLELFDRQTQIVRDCAWVESHLGNSTAMDLVVGIDKKAQRASSEAGTSQRTPTPEEAARQDYQYSLLERVELVGHVQHAVEEVFGEQGEDLVDPALSAATFTSLGLDPLDPQRAAAEAQLAQSLEQLVRQDYLASDSQSTELWRITLRVSALNKLDYAQFIEQLKRVVEPVLKAYALRDDILRTVAELHPQGSDAAPRWTDTKIAVMGASDPREEVDQVTTIDAVPERILDRIINPREGTQGQDDRMLGVHRVFARVLGDLLRAKGYQGKRAGRLPKQYIAWQDPRKNPLGENKTSEAWAQTLATFDCVVVLRDHPDYDQDFIRQHAKRVIDARQHGFDPAEEKTARQLGKSIGVTYTGMVPVMERAQRTLWYGLFASTGCALAIIALLMMIVTRLTKVQVINVRGGLVSMLPIIFPLVAVFGYLGRENVAVDVGTAIAAGLATGMVVLGTIQFLAAFRSALREGFDRPSAIQEASSRVVVSMLQITLVICLGLTVLALSSIVPVQRLGLTTASLLGMGLVGNLFLLPALLAGPLGKYVCPPVPAVEARREVAEDGGVEEELCLEHTGGPGATGTGQRHSPPRESRTASAPRVRRDGSHL